MHQSPHSKSNPIWVGLFLIALGILFLGNTYNIFHLGHIISDWWPLILIGIGLYKFNKHERSGGIVMIIIGSLFLLSELNIVSWHQISRLWPIVLIIIGIGMLVKRTAPAQDNSIDFVTSPEDKFEINSIFSNFERQVTSQQFRGGEINAIFGNIKLDLRNAKVVPEGATLNASAVFGSIVIYTSPGMAIDFHSSQFFGRADNMASSAQTGPVLKITGDAVFGNIRISN